MKLLKLLLIITCIFFQACKEIDRKIANSIIPGRIENRIYSNIFFSLQIPEGWNVGDTNDRSQLLVISKTDLLSFQRPNIIFFATDSDEALAYYGYKSREEEFLGFINDQKTKGKVEIIEGIKSIIIEGRRVDFIKIEEKESGNEFKQYVFSFPVEGFFVTALATFDNESAQDEIVSIIKSIDFQ